MSRKIVIALTFSIIVGIICLGLASASTLTNGIHAKTKLTRHVFEGVGDEEIPWQYIYVKNPTWQTVNIQSVQIDTYVNRVFHPEISYWLTPENFQPTPEYGGWDTDVLPFEESVILYHGWIVGEDEPEGVYVFDITIYATVMEESIELKTRSTFNVFL